MTNIRLLWPLDGIGEGSVILALLKGKLNSRILNSAASQVKQKGKDPFFLIERKRRF
jgi:hypothetical protein